MKYVNFPLVLYHPPLPSCVWKEGKCFHHPSNILLHPEDLQPKDFYNYFYELIIWSEIIKSHQIHLSPKNNNNK